MRVVTSVLVTLIVLANLVFANPSFADDNERPRYDRNPDYIAITQELNALSRAKDTQAQSENYNPEEIQTRIAELEFQKYALETGSTWGQCRNETGKTLAVYGPKPKKSPTSYENVLYFLADGQTTQEQWDCSGIYLPNDVKVSASNSDKQGQAKDVKAKSLSFDKPSQSKGVKAKSLSFDKPSQSKDVKAKSLSFDKPSQSKDVKVASASSDEQGQKLTGPVAVKIVDGTQVVVKSNPETGAVEFSVPPAKVFKAGEANWFIPNVSQSAIATRVPNAPTGAAPSNEES